MRKKQEISTAKLKSLEEDFRSKPRLDFLIAVAERRNNYYSLAYYKKLQREINTTYERLAPELKYLVDKCFWGDNDYLDWANIGEVYFSGSERNAFDARYKILEEFAIVKGILIR